MKKFAEYTQEELMQEAERRIEEAHHTGAEVLRLDFWTEDYPGKTLYQLIRTDITLPRLEQLPQSIYQLTNLKELYASGNAIQTLSEEFGKLTGLQKIDLVFNQLTALPESLGQLTQLHILNLSENQLTFLPENLGQLAHLQELNLMGNELTTLPESLGQLSELHTLNLMSNELMAVPEVLGRLTQLHALDFMNNQLTVLPECLSQLTQLHTLDITDNQLTALPESLGQLTQLQELHLADNQLTALPESLGQLTQLHTLNLLDNQITALPESLGQLTKLWSLDLQYNQLTVLPESLGQLTQLHTLDLADNQLTALPESLGQLSDSVNLRLEENPLPPELLAIYEESTLALLAYLRAPKVALYEAKLILVGEGEVGKSCLLGALRGEPWRKRNSTHGVEIKPVPVTDLTSGQDITLNGWDFGGQQVYRPTHQLFFSAPAVYLVVWKPREGHQQGAVQEWIRLVKYREPTAKVIVVATHGGPGQRQPDIDKQELWDLFGYDTVVGFASVNSKDGTDIESLRAQIAEVAAALPEMGRRVPEAWLAARATLQALPKPYYSREEIEALCQAQGMSLTEAARFVRVAHELGYLINYQHDELLRDIVILKPDWLTKALSFVLDDASTRDGHGLVTFERLGQLWSDPARPAAERYPAALHPVFLRLMERFELSYRITDEVDSSLTRSTSLVAQLVPDVRPDLAAWESYPAPLQQTQLCQIVEAKFDQSAPAEGIFYRLIVRMHRYSLGRRDYADSLHWQRGLVVDDGYNGRALLEHIGNDIKVTVKAVYPENLLNRLTGDVRWLVDNFWKGLRCDVMVPCQEPCGRQRPGMGLFNVETLMAYRIKGDVEFPCLVSRCVTKQNIDSLLRNAALPVPTEVGPAIDKLLTEIQALRQQLTDMQNEQREQNALELTRIKELQDTIASMVDTAFTNLLAALDDEGREAPRLFSLEPLDDNWLSWPMGVARRKFRLTLWCEHTRLPLKLWHGLDSTAGEYVLEVPREWIGAAAPFLKMMFTTLAASMPLMAAAGPVGAALGVSAAAAGLTLEGVKKNLEAAAKATESLKTWQEGRRKTLGTVGGAIREATVNDGPMLTLPEIIDNGGPEQASQGALRSVQDFLRKNDPSFGNLARVRNRQRKVLWVSPLFAKNSDYD
ncbi:leucine-rich repeat domain-containing protein [Hymenobacter sp. BT523]|uniref:leucine-rich repeat domain-containing protein n=1 Tax=Hymenobacter sp. BT523 TaxID=2795725 RepID=UPI0018ECD32C|nr:COR domain-containing protein [Hymenobacter sp. BT523]MBJ6111784.1 leucine-rich repeat domain-containing protein [Hymenobacter sp. BT523]